MAKKKEAEKVEEVTLPAKAKPKAVKRTCGNCGNHDHITGDCYYDPITIKSSFTFGLAHRACAQWVEE